jgi:hypothetical protein
VSASLDCRVQLFVEGGVASVAAVCYSRNPATVLHKATEHSPRCARARAPRPRDLVRERVDHSCTSEAATSVPQPPHPALVRKHIHASSREEAACLGCKAAARAGSPVPLPGRRSAG